MKKRKKTDKLEIENPSFNHLYTKSNALYGMIDLLKEKINFEKEKYLASLELSKLKSAIKRVYDNLLLRWIFLKRNLTPNLTNKIVDERNLKDALNKILEFSKECGFLGYEILYFDKEILKIFSKKSKSLEKNFDKLRKKILKKLKKQKLKSKMRLMEPPIIPCLVLTAINEHKLATELWDLYSKKLDLEEEIIRNSVFILREIRERIKKLTNDFRLLENRTYSKGFKEGPRKLDVFGEYIWIGLKDYKAREKFVKKNIKKYFKEIKKYEKRL